ncbi:tyrosine-type recombinase/integrase [Micromonospora sp. CA-111912]|uniref:tyrosine-type recombinase/integrase n=1 Tax=Micromonospora sp. CA-111912 TaxID=3239955 RepID=UPI003D8BB492
MRHHFATRLITSGTDPTDVQNALRHSSLRITLETYRALVAEEEPAPQHCQHGTSGGCGQPLWVELPAGLRRISAQ